MIRAQAAALKEGIGSGGSLVALVKVALAALPPMGVKYWLKRE